MFSYTSSTIEVFLRLLVAAVLGGLIGLEREFHGRLIVYLRTRGLKDKHEIMNRIMSLPNLLQVSWQ
jgi:hypothetical protein